MLMERMVVGCDGSPAGAAALAWSVRRAGSHGVIVVVTAWSPDSPARTDLTSQRETVMQAQRRAIRQALDCCPAAVPPVVLSTIVQADPVIALCQEATSADRVVIGVGSGRVARALRHALMRQGRSVGTTCPLTMVPAPGPTLAEPWRASVALALSA